MNPQLDVGKLVGAASAPVALIIATCILLGNLGGKYVALVNTFRQIAADYRAAENINDVRCRSLARQLTHYSRRIRSLIRATCWLNTAIVLFILTVGATGFATMFPRLPVLTYITGAFSYAGLLVLVIAVTLEMLENRRSINDLVFETAEFPDVLDNDDQEDLKRKLTRNEPLPGD